MIAGLDSATPPTATQVAVARAAGVRLWSGYLATTWANPDVRTHFNILRPWTQAEFEIAHACGGTPIAFCSGWDDPVAVKALAAAWRVRPCLDVESGIRGDGPWVQPWLDASGTGLYGNVSIHDSRHATFHILSGYVADPSRAWPRLVPPPATPCGWQWQGTHDEFGVGVDRGWYDDWFAADDSPQEAPMAAIIRGTVGPEIYVTDGLRKRHLASFQEVADIAAAFGITSGDANHVTTVQQATVDAIPDVGVGLTAFDATITPK